MKISNDTIGILKNFSTINQGILFKPGKTIKTISNHKNILAEAVVDEEFPVEIGIYELNNFLATLSIHKDAKLEFNDVDIVIHDGSGRRKTNYRGCSSKHITAPSQGNLDMPNPEIVFDLTQEDLEWFLQAASVLASPHVGVQSDGKTINLVAFNSSDDAAHVNTFEVGKGNGDVYKIIFKTENLKMITDSYTVSISSKGFANFKSKNKKIQYWITTEKGGEYKKK